MVSLKRDSRAAPATWTDRVEETVLGPIRHTSPWYYVLVAFLVVVIGWGVYAYSLQFRHGLIETGMRDRISWGLYISLFVFFIGISHAGTLVSAILRVSNAGWRTPITRIAEFITVVALMTGALFVIIDLGRPDRLLNVIIYGRWQSPIAWDVIAVTTYLASSIVYLYLPMIPDLALFRDRLTTGVATWKKRLYQVLAVGWVGRESQMRPLSKALTILMILIIPIAVSVHTVVSWIFGMTLRTGWNSTIFGIMFVAGAIFSGVATLIIVLAVLRKVYHLEEYITLEHFQKLAYLLAAFSLIMLYVNISEFLTTGYKLEGSELFRFRELFVGQFAGMYWFYFYGGLMLPGLVALFSRTRTIPFILGAAVVVDISMFLERYFIVVAGLKTPLMPYAAANYAPTWVEWSIMAAGFAWFTLLIALFVKVFPILAVWEIAEHHGSVKGAPEGAVAEPSVPPRRWRVR
jgi:molybdopterin-containing oxidoreductase family membrane subunit